MQAGEIDGYRIESECASGGGVRLLRARQIVADAPVLLQIWDGPSEVSRNAIRTLAGLRHPGLATVLDVGESSDGHAYAALSALPGPSVAQQLAAGMDLDQSVALVRRLALVLQFLEQRGALPPRLEPELILGDAQGRPVLSCLQTHAQDDRSAPTRALIGVFHEALTGHAAVGEAPQLPEYLRRWQPVVDLLGDNRRLTPECLLETLDVLQGRSPRPMAMDVTQVSTPNPKPIATDSALAESTPASHSAPPPAMPTVAPAAASDTASQPSATVVRATSPAAPPRPNSACPPQLRPEERVTAPGKRLSVTPIPAPTPTATALGRGEHTLPAPPSRLPLILAAALGVPVLAGLGWWLLSSGATSGLAAQPAVAEQRGEPIEDVAIPAPAPRPRAVPVAATVPVEELDEEALPPQAATLDPRNLPTVEDPLERLLLYARTNVQAGRLIEPPGRNALDRYLQALRIEQGNRAARTGISDLGMLCLGQARDAGTLEAQLGALACVERVAAAHEAGRSVADAAREFRQAEHDRHLIAGQGALARWQSKDAAAHFANALGLMPESKPAATGMQESERQGKPGYRFHDTLSDGTRGPEMLIAGGLAWGRSEVTVGQFERYWAAAGQARFGTDMPACRDRESMLRSSRKRDWQTPDFPQTDMHPVACVSHAMAQHYAEWLSGASEQPYRLPRLSEWQALAGTAPLECRANFRDQSAARAWNAREAANCDDGQPYTAAVNAAGETAGVLGLWGNLAEWLSDCEGGNCRHRLAAGGSWFSTAGNAGPRGFAAEPGFTTIGFRVVRELPTRD